MKWYLTTCKHFHVYSPPLGKHCNHNKISKVPRPSTMKGRVVSTGWPGYSLCDHFAKLCGYVETVAWAGEGKFSSVLDRLWWRCQADCEWGWQVPTYIVKSGACGEVRARDTVWKCSSWRQTPWQWAWRRSLRRGGWKEERRSKDWGDKRALKHLARWRIRDSMETQR